MAAPFSSLLQQARSLVKEKQAMLARNEEMARQNLAEAAKVHERIEKVSAEMDDAFQSFVRHEDENPKLARASELVEKCLVESEAALMAVGRELNACQTRLASATNLYTTFAAMKQARQNQVREAQAAVSTAQCDASQAAARVRERSCEALHKHTSAFASAQVQVQNLTFAMDGVKEQQSAWQLRVAQLNADAERMQASGNDVERDIVALRASHERCIDELARVRAAEVELCQRASTAHAQHESTRAQLVARGDARCQHEECVRAAMEQRIVAMHARWRTAQAALDTTEEETRAANVQLHALVLARDERVKSAKQRTLDAMRKQCQERLAAKLVAMTAERDDLAAQKQALNRMLVEAKKKRKAAKRAMAATARVTAPPPPPPPPSQPSHAASKPAALQPTTKAAPALLGTAHKSYHKRNVLAAAPVHKAPSSHVGAAATTSVIANASAHASAKPSKKGLLYKWAKGGSAGKEYSTAAGAVSSSSAAAAAAAAAAKDDVDIFTFT